MEWKDERGWYNDRIIHSVISSEEVDFHNEKVMLSAIEKTLPFLAKHGIYNYWHSSFPIGEILAWGINEEGLPCIKVGIHDTIHSNVPQHDDVWEEIKKYGTTGMSSIEGVSNLNRTMNGKPREISDMGLWSVAWVGSEGANPRANVEYINSMAKIAKSINMMPNSQGQLVKINYQENIKEYINEEIKKQIGGIKMTQIKKQEEEDVPVPEAEPVDEAPAEDVIPTEEAPPEEEMPVEPVDEVAKEEPSDGLAQQVASIREELKILAEAIQMLKSGTPDALADAADAAEVVTEIIESDVVEELVSGEDAMLPDPEAESEDELVMMRKELAESKAENEELKKTVPNPVEKATPKRRGVVTQNIQPEEPKVFNSKEIVKAANNGKLQEFMKERFNYNRKVVR